MMEDEEINHAALRLADDFMLTWLVAREIARFPASHRALQRHVEIAAEAMVVEDPSLLPSVQAACGVVARRMGEAPRGAVLRRVR